MSRSSVPTIEFNFGVKDFCRYVASRLGSQNRVPASLLVIGAFLVLIIVAIAVPGLSDGLGSVMDTLLSVFMTLVDQYPLFVIGGGVVIVIISFYLLSHD